MTVETEVVHRCPSTGSGTMPCCGRSPFEVPRSHRMTLDDTLVTCRVAEVAATRTHLWVLELDSRDWPSRCHSIVRIEAGRCITACGLTHHEGWPGCWSTETPESPLPKLACPGCERITRGLDA